MTEALTILLVVCISFMAGHYTIKSLIPELSPLQAAIIASCFAILVAVFVGRVC